MLPLLYERCVAHNRSNLMSESNRPIRTPGEFTSHHSNPRQGTSEEAIAHAEHRVHEDSAEVRAVKGQSSDLERLHEALSLLRTKMRNKLRPEPECPANECAYDRPQTVLDHIVVNNHRINGLTALVSDLFERYQT
jgi:hypothetical protein